MTTTPARKRRLGDEDWLALALEVLSREGEADLRIDRLCEGLGVTKGSFYAHFENRADFVRRLVAYWAEESTESTISVIDNLEDETAEARLLALMRLLRKERKSSYDFIMRAWAIHDSTVAEGVQEVDRQRFKFVRRIFHQMGFRGAELDLRTRIFIAYHSTDPSMLFPQSGLSMEEELKLQHAFFTRR